MSTELGSASRTVPGAGRSTFEGKVSVGDAEEALLAMKNPYDTIALQAAESAIGRTMPITMGNIMCISVLSQCCYCICPYYLADGGALQNYVAVFVFCRIYHCGGWVCL